MIASYLSRDQKKFPDLTDSVYVMQSEVSGENGYVLVEEQNEELTTKELQDLHLEAQTHDI